MGDEKSEFLGLSDSTRKILERVEQEYANSSLGGEKEKSQNNEEIKQDKPPEETSEHDEKHENDPNQIHMAPLGLIFPQDESYRVWEASGTPPGLQKPSKNLKNPIANSLFFALLFSTLLDNMSSKKCRNLNAELQRKLRSGTVAGYALSALDNNILM